MTDLEISKALALAIGWTPFQMDVMRGEVILVRTGHEFDRVRRTENHWLTGHRVFDYRDWNVIGPIAARYRMFPQPYMSKWNVRGWSDTIADTPQKAIALAVIGANT